MKKIISLFTAFFVMLSCTNSQDLAKLEKEEREALEKIVHKYNDKPSIIKAEYDEKEQCVNLSWKCKTLTASYNLHFKDLLSNNPTSYADGFIISVSIIKKGITTISSLEFIYEGITFKALPFTSNSYIKDVAVAGFSASNESSRECLKMLSNLSGVVTGKIYTDKGTIDIPLGDVFNLRGMARSYIMDGGKFE